MARAKDITAKDVKVEYTISMTNPNTHLLEVEIKFTGLPPAEDTLELIMPVWRPGRYLIFDFSSGVQEFEAYDENDSLLKYERGNKFLWRIYTNKSAVLKVKYKVYANEFNLRTRGLNSEHAFVNVPAVFMYAEKYRSNELTLRVNPYSKWHVTTGLENIGGDGFYFSAPGYDYFSDCPLEIGNQTDFEFDVEGKKHVFSIYGEAHVNKERIIEDFTKIIKYNYKFWGSVPYEKYVFVTHCTPQSGGGTEHINSTVLGAKRSAFETEAGYINYLRLVSHEFFHTWNVKQLKPRGLSPYDFTKENYTSELWIAEGGTSYYDGLNILRTGQYKLDEFMKEISKAIEDDERRPGNRIQPVADSSYDAWVKFWRRTQNSYNSESDYYGRGSYLCLILDLAIRNSSGNKHSLDDVFKNMFNDFPLDRRGYTNEDFRKYAEDAAGISFGDFFSDHINGTKAIDWKKYLSYAGLEIDSSGKSMVPVVGMRTAQKDGRIIISEIIAGTSSEKAGLSYGDEIIAMNGSRLSYAEMESQMKEISEGESVVFTISRNDKLGDVTLDLKGTLLTEYKIKKTAEPTVLQKDIYEKWLNVEW